jgi:hypothetical protein
VGEVPADGAVKGGNPIDPCSNDPGPPGVGGGKSGVLPPSTLIRILRSLGVVFEVPVAIVLGLNPSGLE